MPEMLWCLLRQCSNLREAAYDDVAAQGPCVHSKCRTFTASQAGRYNEELVALRERVACMAEELTTARQAAPSRLQDSPLQEPEALGTPVEAEDAEIQVCLLSLESGEA